MRLCDAREASLESASRARTSHVLIEERGAPNPSRWCLLPLGHLAALVVGLDTRAVGRLRP